MDVTVVKTPFPSQHAKNEKVNVGCGKRDTENLSLLDNTTGDCSDHKLLSNSSWILSM